VLLLTVCALRGLYAAAGSAAEEPEEIVDPEVTAHAVLEEDAAPAAAADDAGPVFSYALYSALVGGAGGDGRGEQDRPVPTGGDGDEAPAARTLTAGPDGKVSLGAVTVDDQAGLAPDLTEVMEHLKTLDRAGEEPLVLIVHTHTSEAYMPAGGDVYEASDPGRTEDPNYNVVRVGDEIAAVLEENGIPTLHDTTVHDYPSYTGAYGRSLRTVEDCLAAHPGIRVVLDIHRDAVEQADGSAYATATTLSTGERTARAMLVVGTDGTGLEHPDWESNLAFAVVLQQHMLGIEADFARDIHLSANRYNQHLTPFSLIVEVGSSGDTLSEALACARLFARAAAETIEELST